MSAVLAAGAACVAAAACGSGGDAAVALEAGSPRCPSAAPTESAAWNAPDDAGSGPCDTASLAVLASALASDVPPSYLEIERRLRESDASAHAAACASCVFTASASPVWGPFVAVDDAGTGFVNYAACYARAQGGSDACGRAVHQQTACLDAVCTLDGGACRAETLRLCAQQALQQTEGCGRFDVAAACGQAISQLTAACQTPLAVVTRLCGSAAPVDAGADSGAR